MPAAPAAPLTRATGPAAGAALVLGAASLWATFGIFAKYLYAAGFTPLELASVRAAVGFIIVALWILPAALRGRFTLRLSRASLLFFAAYGIVGFALFEVVFLAAFERIPVSIAVALLYTAPAFVVLISAVVWRERIGRTQLAALVLVLSGVVLVTGAVEALRQRTATLHMDAVLLGLGAGLGYALYTLFSKAATARYGAAAALFWSFGFATAALAFVAPPITPFLRAPSHTLMLLALGIVPTILPYALFLTGLRELRAGTAAMLASIEPVIAALLAVFLLSERLDLLQALGMMLVVAAAALLARAAARAQA